MDFFSPNARVYVVTRPTLVALPVYVAWRGPHKFRRFLYAARRKEGRERKKSARPSSFSFYIGEPVGQTPYVRDDDDGFCEKKIIKSRVLSL